MRLTVDSDADALYLRLSEATIADSQQVAPGVVLDYDAHDNLVGVEMLHISKRVPSADLGRLLLENLPVAHGQALAHESSPPYSAEPPLNPTDTAPEA